ncbi:MAG: dihydrolipoyl dehydrogenase [Candidatus Omnitrophica bacterium]|nr:dihydrolipoyl dehydrogenase [Candidatus Omnitrophota bacterium]
MYDIAIIGAGWAGFNAAIKARDLGLKTVLLEKGPLGGTCLNCGCIPTKSLIQSAKVYNLTKKSSVFGIEATSPTVDFSRIQERKDKIVQQLQGGMKSLLKDIDFLEGEADILSNEEIKVSGQNLKTKAVLIATGSRPAEISSLKFDGKKIISSDEVLNLKEIPKSLLIIGAGVIGCEFAGLFSSFGSQVHLVEKMPQVLPGIDKEVANKLQNIFKKKGIKVETGIDAANLDPGDYELILVSVGRIPDTKSLSLEKIGIGIEKGRIITDGYLATNVPGVYAAGDCTGKIMLAHFASYQGIIAAENIARADSPLKADEHNIPSCIFTYPEIAVIGLSQQEAEAKGLDIKINKFDFMGSGMARILDEAEGFIKVISQKGSDELLGASIIGPHATELIASFTLAIQSSFKLKDLKKIIFAHPSLSESITEALK